jgi:outer membrane protein TolC
MRVLAVLILFSMTLAAQVTSKMNSSLDGYSAPWLGSANYWRKNFGHMDKTVTLRPPIKLKDFVVDGKLRLSLRDYLDLVVNNNTDIGIQRLTLETPMNAIQRASAIFDPTLTANYSATRSETPATNQLQGANVVSSLQQPFTTRIQQLTPFSTSVFSQLNINRNSTNDSFQTFNPSYSPTWQMGFIQPLLRNRGRYITKLPITIAKAQRVAAEQSFYDQIQRLLVTSENTYWDTASARERLRVQREALKLAEASLERSRREVELGATSPLEVFQPEQNAASAKLNVVQIEYQLQQAEDVLRRQMGADLDPDVRTLPIELTEDIGAGVDKTPFDREQMVALAYEKRPDLRTVRTNIEVNDLQIDGNMNALKPLLNFQGSYSTQGRGGNFRQGGTNPPIIIPGGLADALGQFFTYNTYSFSLNLTLPIRDRAASANLADAVVNRKLNALRLRNSEQQIRQEVLNSVSQVESSRANVQLAEIAVDFARKRAEADQKRYDLGVINIFFLLSAQNDLMVAESQLVNAQVTYRRNVLTLQQRLGTLLEQKNIVIQY